jgi:hypothetical protein
MRQKGVHCLSIKIFKGLPDYLIFLYIIKQFIKEIKDVLIHNPSYTVDEFLLFCRDQQLKNRNGVHTAWQLSDNSHFIIDMLGCKGVCTLRACHF